MLLEMQKNSDTVLWMVQTENTKIEISPENWYTGGKLSALDKTERARYEKVVRIVLDLPITKELVYYTNARDKDSVVKVEKFRISELFDKTELWATLEIMTDSGNTLMIHSWFFRHMQKPSFIKDMEKMTSEQ